MHAWRHVNDAMAPADAASRPHHASFGMLHPQARTMPWASTRRIHERHRSAGPRPTAKETICVHCPDNFCHGSVGGQGAHEPSLTMIESVGLRLTHTGLSQGCEGLVSVVVPAKTRHRAGETGFARWTRRRGGATFAMLERGHGQHVGVRRVLRSTRRRRVRASRTSAPASLGAAWLPDRGGNHDWARR